MSSFCAGIHILIKKDNKYLVIKRSNNDEGDPGCWDLPGGGIDSSEQPYDAAIREAKEETGINIKVMKVINSWAIEHKGSWSIELIVEGEYLSGDIILSAEHSDFKWISEEELLSIQSKSIHLKSIERTHNEL